MQNLCTRGTRNIGSSCRAHKASNVKPGAHERYKTSCRAASCASSHATSRKTALLPAKWQASSAAGFAVTCAANLLLKQFTRSGRRFRKKKEPAFFFFAGDGAASSGTEICSQSRPSGRATCSRLVKVNSGSCLTLHLILGHFHPVSKLLTSELFHRLLEGFIHDIPNLLLIQ